MKKYKKKFIVSGDILELYEYENDIYTDYDLSKFREHTGRCNSSVTDEDTKRRNREKTSHSSSRNVRRLVNTNIQENSKFVTLTFREDIKDLKESNYIFKKFSLRSIHCCQFQSMILQKYYILSDRGGRSFS